jgi:PAS domain S-box-containing protein
MVELQYTPYAFPLLLAACVSAVLAWIAWRRRPGSGVLPFIVLMVGLTEWTLASLIEYSTVSLQPKLFATNLAYIGITTAPAAWLAFVSEYTGRNKWLTRRNVLLLFIEPVLIVVLAFTNDFHHLFRTAVALDTTGSFPVLSVTNGPTFWIHAAYSYILLVIGNAILIQAFLRSPQLYRGQVFTLLIGAFIPWIANIVTVFDMIPNLRIDLTPFAFTVTGLMLSWSLFRFKLLDIVPVARDTLVESMSDAVMVIDAQGRIVDMNPAALRLVGNRSSSELIGKLAAEALVEQQDLVKQFRSVMEARVEVTIGKGTATERYFELQISPLRNRYGTLTGRLYVLRDITALKGATEQIKAQNDTLRRTNQELAEAQRKTEEASRLKSEFLATMSHELRTPLNAIIGFADLALTGLTGPLNAKQEDYLARISANGERLLAQINDLLDISKIEAGRVELSSQPFAPSSLLTDMRNQIQSLVVQKGLGFDTQLDPGLPPQLLGDSGRLGQILTNLIGNAVRFTQAGQISVRMEKVDESKWGIVVTDTGIGIPPHALEYIFDEFRQVDGSTQREHGGTGLGLAIVRKLAILMGGTVRAQSTVGKGSTFTVQLPLKVPEMLVAEVG